MARGKGTGGIVVRAGNADAAASQYTSTAVDVLTPLWRRVCA